MKTTSASDWLLVAIPLVALAEIAVQWRIPHGDPSASDWRAAAEVVAAEKEPGDLVVITPDWAVHGRVHLGGSIPPADLGRFDTTRHHHLFEISLRDARAPEVRGLTPLDERRFGALTVRRYDLPPAAEVVYDLLENLERCAIDGGQRPRAQFLVDHSWAPRRVVPVGVSGRPVRIACDGVPGGNTLRGHAVVGRLDYRAHRLPSGAPIRLSFAFDGAPAGEVLVDNLSPPTLFEIALPGNGPGTLEIEVSARDGFDRTLGVAADVRGGALHGDQWD